MFWSSLHCSACFDIMEQLQLQVEVLLFDQDEGSLVEMIDLFGIEREQVEQGAENKSDLIVTPQRI